MLAALSKTGILLLLIVLGFLLKLKFKNKEQTDGIKEIILSVALPSTIFIALMKIELEASLLIIPLITLIFNFLLYAVTPAALALFGISKNTSTGRTMMMLMPSLAPGLSSFPFIAEFLGDESLALAAMADVGNKFFVLIFLYVIALNMFLKNTHAEQKNVGEKLKSLLLSLVQEPINIILFLAIGLLMLGINYSTLPNIIQGIFDKTSAMMTPLVLLFIGLAVKFKEGNKRMVVSLLFFRAGFSMLFTAILVLILNIHDTNTILLATVVPLSAISFWPFAHISVFAGKEALMDISKEKQTFKMDLAVMVLALSLPFSTLLVLAVLTAGNYFANPTTLFFSGFTLALMGVVPMLISRLIYKVSRASAEKQMH